MNKLRTDERSKIVQLLVEGNSLRSVSRIMDVSINTVTGVLVKVGQACMKFHDETVINLNTTRVECDEIWSFVYAKARNVKYTVDPQKEGIGDVWTWTAIDADSKLILSYYVGTRDIDAACDFMGDVASRLKNRVQLSTDGFNSYLTSVPRSFYGNDVDYGQVIKKFGVADENPDTKYSPSEIISMQKRVVFGNPDEKLISTSYVERQNLTMRMHMRRFTRLTNAFSKKIENHCYAIALHFVYYNFCKIHKTKRCTPAMAAKLTDRFMTIEEIVNYAYADEIAAEEKRIERKGGRKVGRKPYKVQK